MVTLAEPALLESDCKAAVTVTVGGLGAVLGAVNRPESLMVPTAEFPPGIVLTCQTTVGLAAFCTSAWKCTWSPVKDCAEEGVTVTVTGAGGGVLGDTRPPQEIKNIVSSGKTMNSNERAECCTPGRKPSRGC